MNFSEKLDKYAQLIVRTGVNVQPGQPVCISGSVEIATLVRLVAKKAYEAGASEVFVDWKDETLTRLRYEKAADEVFNHFPMWERTKREILVQQNGAFITFSSPNPALLEGIDPERISLSRKASGEALKMFKQAVQANKISWTVVAAATKDWASKVFPNEKCGDEAVNKLWQAIFDAVRLETKDPVLAWKDHNKNLQKKSNWLNKQHFTALKYVAPGTDLEVGLSKNHVWVAAGSVNASGTPFMANMPTEEVFTVPDKLRVEGFVSSTKPLNDGGNLIDGFKLTFKKGKIVKVDAKQGKENLEYLIASDEGAHYLGEVALVPYQSPISQVNILFMNTLFDENAACHFAIGSGYAFNITCGETMSQEELAENGVNNSIIHVDFMIGSDKLDIYGIKEDGSIIPVFHKGNWAF